MHACVRWEEVLPRESNITGPYLFLKFKYNWHNTVVSGVQHGDLTLYTFQNTFVYNSKVCHLSHTRLLQYYWYDIYIPYAVLFIPWHLIHIWKFILLNSLHLFHLSTHLLSFSIHQFFVFYESFSGYLLICSLVLYFPHVKEIIWYFLSLTYFT